MNMFKSNGGFTLVELIVVIAILAILAGIAVPAYSGYIKKAEQAAEIQYLSTINTAVQGLYGAMGVEFDTIVVKDGKVLLDGTEDVTSAVADLVGAIDESASGIWSDGSWSVSSNNGGELEEEGEEETP